MSNESLGKKVHGKLQGLLGSVVSALLVALFLITPLYTVFAEEAAPSSSDVTVNPDTPSEVSADQPPIDTSSIQSAIDQSQGAPQDIVEQTSDTGVVDKTDDSLNQTSSFSSIAANKWLNSYQYNIPTPEPSKISGAFTYNVPIITPPGRNGVQPQLQLSYNSQDKDTSSIFGFGWSLNIPYIERMNKSGADQMYNQSYYTSTLDGELATSTATSTTQFAAKFDGGDMRQYTFSTSTNIWTVLDKNGTQYMFGSSTTGRIYNSGTSTTQIFRWMLEKVQDTNGNYMTYSYTKNGDQIYPSQIIYTANGTTTAPFEVDFTTESRSGVTTLYNYGFGVTSSYRVNEIDIKFNSNLVNKYVLAYTTGHNQSKDLLSSVTQTAYDNSGTATTLPAMSFTYFSGTVGWPSSTPSPFNLPRLVDSSGKDQGFRVLNYRRNQPSDFIRVTSTSSPVGYEASDWSSLSLGSVTIPGMVDGDYNDIGTAIVDVNGDGFPDIVRGQSSTTAPYTYQEVWVWGAAGTGSYGTVSMTNTPLLVDSSGNDLGIRFGDFNGDGYEDYIRGIDGSTYYLYLNNGDGTGWASPIQPSNQPSTFVDSSGNDTGARVMDVNGDGLDDVISRNTATNVVISLNKGGGTDWTNNTFSSTTSNAPPQITGSNGADVGTRVADIDGDGLLDFVVSSSARGTHLFLNKGDGQSFRDVTLTSGAIPYFLDAGSHDTGTRIMEGNGDAVPDFVTSSNSTHADYLSQSGSDPASPSDVLIQVTVPTGGYISAVYQGSRINSTIIQTVKSITKVPVTASLTPIVQNFSYSGGFYQTTPFNRKFAGFSKISESDNQNNYTLTYYHQGDGNNTGNPNDNFDSYSVGEYNDTEAKMYRPYRVEKYSLSPLVTTSYQMNRWDTKDLGNNRSLVYLRNTTNKSFDGTTSIHQDSATSFDYATTTGNLIQKIDWGEVTASSDDGTYTDTGSDMRTTTIAYASTSPSGVTGLPSTVSTVDQGSTKTSETRTYYDNQVLGALTLGNATKQENWITGSTYSSSTKTYDAYGLVTQAKDPLANTTTFTYDMYHLYPATTTNAVSQATGYTYDYTTGKIKNTFDPNSRLYTTSYDGLGRPLTVSIPDPSTGSLVTKATYAYTDTATAVSILETEYLNSSTSTNTYTYLDGFGRNLQTRKIAEGTYTAKDWIYNNRGLVSAESLPYFSSGSSRGSANGNSNLYTYYSYDNVGRLASTSNAVGYTTYEYPNWRTIVTDPRGKKKDFYKDAYGNLTNVVEYLSGTPATTTYVYDTNNNLTKITDALANVRNFTYDGLGERLTSEDLHASADTLFGTSTYTYDKAGNITQFKDPKNQTINYTYDALNRPLTEDYTGTAGTEVSYAYDTCLNGKGRLCFATSTAGTVVSKYEYDPVGNTSKETKVIGTDTFATQYAYDRQGGLGSVTYPDGSQTQYFAGTFGLTERVLYRNSTSGSYFDILTDVDYSPLNQVTYLAYGNGALTFNDFDDSQLYRLVDKYTLVPDLGTQGSGLAFSQMMRMGASQATPKSPAAFLALATSTKFDPQKVGLDIEGNIFDSSFLDGTPNPGKLIYLPYDPDAKQRSYSKAEIKAYGKRAATKSSYKKSAGSGAPKIISGTNYWGSSLAEFHTSPQSIATSTIATSTATTSQASFAPMGGSMPLLSGNPPRESQQLNTEGLWLSEDILYNSGMEEETSEPWNFYGATTTTTLSQDCTTSWSGSCSAKIVSTGLGEFWESAFYQDLRLNAGVNYQLKFHAKSLATSTLVALSGQDHDPYDDYGLHITATTTPTWQEYTYWFTAPSTDEESKIFFGLAAATSTFWIDDVELVPDNLNKLENPSFEDSLNSWDLYSEGGVGNGAGTNKNVCGNTQNRTEGNCADLVDMTAAGLNWHVQLYQSISVATGTTYVLTFDGKAANQRTGSFALQQDHSPYDQLSSETSFTLYPTWNRYVVEIPATSGDAVAVLNFYLGTNISDVYLDNIHLWPKTSTKITNGNPNFTARYDDPDSPDTATAYQLQVMERGDVFDDPLWDSGKQTLSSSTPEGTITPNMAYGADALLENGKKFYWRLKLWDTADNEGPWTNGRDYFNMAGNRVQKYDYTYDANGNITEIIDHSYTNTRKTTTYTYDDLNRMLTASTTDAVIHNGDYKETYTYDVLGNITAKNGSSYTYAGTGYANPDAVTSLLGKTYTYDQNGNLTSVTSGTTNTWDYRNRLTKTVFGTTTQYLYDTNDQRIKYWNASTSIEYPTALFSQTATTVVKTRHLYLNDLLIADVQSSTSTATSTYFIHTDHLGGTNVVSTNSTTTVAEVNDYYPYGGNRVNEHPLSFDTTRKYIGEDYDVDSSYNYLNARYLSGTQGQFISQDPIFLGTGQNLNDPQTLNSYSYANDNPVTLKDPSGKCGLLTLLCVAAIEYGAAAIETAVTAYFVSEGLKNAKTTFNDPTASNRDKMLAGLNLFVIGLTGRAGKSELFEARLAAEIEARYTTKIAGAEVKYFAKTYRGTVDLSPTLQRIEKGETLSQFKNDGAIFENRKNPLRPQKQADYYHEYVVPTANEPLEGTQRIIAGKNGERYYTPDHYETFIDLSKR